MSPIYYFFQQQQIIINNKMSSQVTPMQDYYSLILYFIF